MTIDEAIAHEREVAKNKRKNFDECNTKNNYACKFCIEIRTCKEVAEEHEQLAEWLEELKSYKEKPEGWMWDEAEMKGYNKALDDFVNACKEDISCQTFGLHIKGIERIAARLKAGGKNENTRLLRNKEM